jgi:acyl-CoA hydrolase
MLVHVRQTAKTPASNESVCRLLSAVRVVDPLVVASGNCASPHALLQLLDETVASYRLFMLNAPGDIPCRAGVSYLSPFIGPGMRRRARLGYLPCRLSMVPRLLATHLPPDLVLLNTSLPRDGMVSLGVEVNVLPAAIESAHAHGGKVIAQLNRAMPFTRGPDALVSLDSLDAVIEVDEPLASPGPRALNEQQMVIGDRVAGLVTNGATLQIGIGAVPDALLERLRDHRQLRIWSEMIGDGVLGLAQAGALADSPLVTSFVVGSPELYDWVDDNPAVTLARTETTNDLNRIGQQPRMTAINTAMQVDLFGQANASHVPSHVHSGAGGQDDFIEGALRSAHGVAVIALPSWHIRSDTSTIVARIDGPAASFQPSHVVTELGTAQVWGRSADEQAYELIEHVAKPCARDQLWQAAAAILDKERTCPRP